MIATRAPFDPAAAFIVACEEMPIAGKKLRRGEVFPWRELGVSRDDLGLLWLGLKIDVATTAMIAPPPARPAKKQARASR